MNRRRALHALAAAPAVVAAQDAGSLVTTGTEAIGSPKTVFFTAAELAKLRELAANAESIFRIECEFETDPGPLRRCSDRRPRRSCVNERQLPREVDRGQRDDHGDKHCLHDGLLEGPALPALSSAFSRQMRKTTATPDTCAGTSRRARLRVLRSSWNRIGVEGSQRRDALGRSVTLTMTAGGQAVMTTESMFSTSTVMVRVTSARTPARSAASSR